MVRISQNKMRFGGLLRKSVVRVTEYSNMTSGVYNVCKAVNQTNIRVALAHLSHLSKEEQNLNAATSCTCHHFSIHNFLQTTTWIAVKHTLSLLRPGFKSGKVVLVWCGRFQRFYMESNVWTGNEGAGHMTMKASMLRYILYTYI